MNLKRLFLYTLIASVAFSALMGIGVILFGNFGELEFRVLLTTLTITVTSIAGLACGAYYESGRGRSLPVTGMVLAISAAAMVMLIIWKTLDEPTTYVKATLTVTMLAVSASHLSLLSMARLDKRFAWSRIAAFVFIGLLNAILLYILWLEPPSSGDMIARVIGVLSILIAAITVITPVFHKLSRDDDKTEIESIDAEIAQLKTRLNELETKKAGLTSSVGE